MKVNRPIAFVVLAFVIGATISQGSFAFADDSSTNPFRAIWQAIGELQTKTDSLQSQINDLKAQQNSPSATSSPGQIATKVSETSLAIDLSSGQAGQTLVSLVAKNAGPDSAVGVKLSTYYQMSLFQVNHIDGAQCTDQARGIIECYLGTIESGGEARITIDATPVQLGQQAIITADVSSITQDSNPGNNHAETVFVTSQAPVAIPPAQQQQPTTVVPPAEQPSASNQTSAGQPVQNQTSAQTPTEQSSAGNQTGTQETRGSQSTEQQPAGQGGKRQAPPSSGEQAPQPAGGEQQSGSGNKGASNSNESSSGSSSGTSSGSSDSSSQSSSSSSTGSNSTASSSSGGSSDSGGSGASSTGGGSSSSGQSGSSSSGDSGSSSSGSGSSPGSGSGTTG
ncbi:MAG: hypothetical protein ABI348_01120 [Nitrososphaera sp.]